MNLAIALAVLSSACGSGGGSSDADADADTDSDADSDTDADTDSDVDSDTDTDTDSDTSAPDLVVSFETIAIFADCMPIVPADPWNVSFDIRYDNTAGSAAATADVTSATLAFGAAGDPVLDLTVDPATSGLVPAGESVVVSHAKTASSPDIDDCTHCGDAVVVEVTFDVSGREVVLTSGEESAGCAF